MLTTTGRVRISRARWLKAQEHERVFWQRLAAGIAEGAVGQLDWYKWRATQLELLLAAVPDAAVTSGKVLEIGSGPIGIVNFLGWGDRYAIDPLEPFYREQPSLIKLRNADAIYLSGSGEQLPMPDGSVDRVISNGVFNLCPDKPAVLAEAFRVLRLGGRLQMADMLLEEGVTPEEVARKGPWSD